ncbi:MAG: bacteriohemerythrin [Magnetococcales bacterium]|nr:bacteriohemerythrin [Magnetococcales bacterium]
MEALTLADVGVERFNNDHQRLFFYIVEFNRLTQRFRERPPLEDEWDQVDSIFPNLTKYTREHFQSEEELMRRHAYPLLDEHVRQHQHLIRHLGIIKEAVDARQTDAIVRLEAFLFEWLQNHINRIDLQYSGCFAWEETREIIEKALFNEMISIEQLRRVIDRAPADAILLDLRTPDEHREGVIPGSTLFPCDHNLENRQDTEPFLRCFTARFDPEQFNPHNWYILVCRSGPRAAIALESFLQHGLKACELIGGIQEWLRQGLQLEAVGERR